MTAGTHLRFNLFARFKSLLFLLPLLLAACGGGGSGSGSGGDSNNDNPDITGNSTINVGTTPANVAAGVTNIVVTGLTPTTLYNVWVHDVSTDVAVTTYADSGYLVSTCSSDNAGVVTEECSTASDADGKIYIKISAAESATYSITVRSIPVNEGAVATPVALSVSTDYAGQVGIGTSYYKLTGLTPGLVYNVSMTSVLVDADLTVSMLNDFSQLCLSENAGELDESCLIPANFKGEIYISTSSGGFGSYYTLNVTATTATENIFEGFSDEPIDTTGMLPYSGTVNYANSYYMFTGLTPGVRYEVRITDNTVNTQIYFYDNPEFLGSSCDLNYGFDVIPERLCVATAPASGNLYLMIPYFGTPGGTYTVDIGLAPVAEGTVDVPKEIPAISMPYDGQVDTTNSYYVITGLTADYVYEVQMNGATHQYTDMWVGDSLSTINQGCDICTLRSNASGEIFVRIDGTSTDNENNDLGAWFTLAFGNPEHAEGSVASPVVIPSDGTKYAGQVDDRVSYYTTSGLVPGKYYQIYQTNDEFENPGVFSYTDNTYASTNCYSLPGICLAPADASGNLHIAIHGPDVYGVSYDLWIQPSPYSFDGTMGAPLDITGDLVTLGTASVHQGSVSYYSAGSGTSYYMLTGLPGSTNYSIVASELTDDISLEVYSDAGFTSQLCTSSRRGTITEQCDVVSGPVGGAVKSVSLYIKVIYDELAHSDQWDGANFTLTASQGGTPLISEGAVNTPVDITSALPYTGAVRKSAKSFYKITGLDPAQMYVMKLSHDKVSMDLSTWTDASYSSVSCREGYAVDSQQVLGCLPTSAGELYIQVQGGFRTDTAFTIELITAPVAEGSSIAPVDISASLPYSGQALDNGSVLYSYYKVAGLVPDADYLVLTQNATEGAYTVAYNNADFSTGYQCFNNGTPPSEACKATANTSGELYIRVSGHDTYGVLFDLDVVPAAVNQGTVSTPVTLSAQTLYKGQADYGGSYYVVTGMTPWSGHHVGLLYQDEPRWLQIFADPNFEHMLCDNSNEEYGTGCGATANASGEIYFKISNNTGYYDLFIQ